jgi:DNA polymerase III sliding clamp (beta) subunit (PCNA family)
MRFSVTAGPLREALSRARQIIPATPSLAAYAGLFLRVQPPVDGAQASLQIFSSDGDSTMTVQLTVEAAAPGQVLLAPRPVLSLLSSLPVSTLVEVLVLDAGDIQFSGQGFNPYVFRPLAATFPVPAEPAPGVRPSGLASLSSALSAVRPAAARDSSAVQLISDDDQLVLHTTDGYRLARAVLPTAGFGTFTGVLSLPVLERVARANPEEVTVDLRGRLVAFRGDGVTVVSRLLATPFPAVDAVLVNAPPPSTSLDPALLTAALSRIASVAEQGTLALEFAGNELHLRASTAEVGAGHEVVALRSPVPSTFQVQLRAPYLHDAISAMGTGDVAVAYSGPLQPLYLSTLEPLSLTHVVMPVRS